MKLRKSVPGWDLPKHHEADLIKRFRKEGEIFLDVGAHVGAWTLNLAPYFRRVFAFEPHPTARETLMGNLEDNRINNVSVIPYALTSYVGKVKLTVYDPPARTTIFDVHPLTPIGRMRQIEVECNTIDFFVSTRLDENDVVSFIKIDAEGAEAEILKGASATFKRFQPCFCIETHSKELAELTAKELLGIGIDHALVSRLKDTERVAYFVKAPP